MEATGRDGVGALKYGADGRRWRFRDIKILQVSKKATARNGVGVQGCPLKLCISYL